MTDGVGREAGRPHLLKRHSDCRLACQFFAEMPAWFVKCVFIKLCFVSTGAVLAQSSLDKRSKASCPTPMALLSKTEAALCKSIATYGSDPALEN